MTRLLWLTVALLCVLRVHNALVSPPEAGYDSSGQLLYLHQVVVEHRWPDARDGWMGYQPPAYYATTAALAWVLGWTTDTDLARAGAVVSGLSSLALLGVAWKLARRVVFGHETTVVALLALLPANLIVGATVTNMALAALLGALCLERLAAAWETPRLQLATEASLGLFGGLAFLGRLEYLPLLGLIPLLGVARGAWRRMPWRDAVLAAALAMSLWMAVASVYLVPNLARYDRLLVSNNDADIFPYFHHDVEDNLYLPGFHSVGWFLMPGARSMVGASFPEALPSLWATTFHSLWGDYYGVFLVHQHPWADAMIRLGGLALLVALGAGTWRSRNDLAHWWPWLATLGATLALYTLYQIRLPEYWCDKAVYCALGYLPGALLIAHGLPRKTEPLLVLLAGLVMWAYWL